MKRSASSRRMFPDYRRSVSVRWRLPHRKTRRFQRISEKRMKGLEPSTFCMARRGVCLLLSTPVYSIGSVEPLLSGSSGLE
jgi:hypothetical protein